MFKQYVNIILHCFLKKVTLFFSKLKKILKKIIPKTSQSILIYLERSLYLYQFY